jgi:hypothetical protein
MSSRKQFQCPHCRIITSNQLSVSIHINMKHEKKRWFKCDICSSMVVNLDPEFISRHYQEQHAIKKSIEKIMDECEIKDKRTIQRLKESIITKEKHPEPSSALVVSEMTHWYTCNECYVPDLYSSKIAIIKHYKDEHALVITTKQAAEECLLDDQEQIKQMIEEGRVEGGFKAAASPPLRLTIKTKTSTNHPATTPSASSGSQSSSISTSTPALQDDHTVSPEHKSRWGMNCQQNYTNLISRAAQRKFSRNSASPPPPSLSRSASSTTIFSPEFFKDEESPDAPISTNSSTLLQL